MKAVTLTPVGGLLELPTDSRLIDGLLARDLKLTMGCGGKGVCATCHIRVRAGQESLTPPTDREERSLRLLATACPESRLACQCRVLGEGVVVEVPDGVYVQSEEELDGLLGERAGYDYLHPLTGRVLIPAGKIITRSVFQEFLAAVGDLKARRSGNYGH